MQIIIIHTGHFMGHLVTAAPFLGLYIEMMSVGDPPGCCTVKIWIQFNLKYPDLMVNMFFSPARCFILLLLLNFTDAGELLNVWFYPLITLQFYRKFKRLTAMKSYFYYKYDKSAVIKSYFCCSLLYGEFIYACSCQILAGRKSKPDAGGDSQFPEILK